MGVPGVEEPGGPSLNSAYDTVQAPVGHLQLGGHSRNQSQEGSSICITP